jgi:hypothetical protein
MKTALDHYGYIPEGMRPILDQIREWMRKLPDAPAIINPNGLWSCHAVSRVVNARFGAHALPAFKDWEVVDGLFNGHWQHSWIKTGHMIIDAYPVASLGGPLFIDADRSSPWALLYTPLEYAPEKVAKFEREAFVLLTFRDDLHHAADETKETIK